MRGWGLGWRGHDRRCVLVAKSMNRQYSNDECFRQVLGFELAAGDRASNNDHGVVMKKHTPQCQSWYFIDKDDDTLKQSNAAG